MRYAEALPVLVKAVESSPLAREWDGAPDRLLRFLHYNVYTVPWRSFEILDVLSRYAGYESLRDRRVLDLGCGLGAMGLYLALEKQADLVVGVEREPAYVEIMRNALAALEVDGLRLVRGDLGRPPVMPGAFDVLVSYDSLYYPGMSKERALRGAHQALRAGGVLVIKVFNRLFPPFGLVAAPGVRPLVTRLFGGPGASSGRLRGFIQPNAATSVGLANLLRRAGFVDVKVYNRWTRQARGWLRWWLPDVIVAARRV